MDPVSILPQQIRSLTLENCEIREDSINRLQAIKAIQKYGVGSFDFEEDNYTPEQAERFVIKLLSELPPAIQAIRVQN